MKTTLALLCAGFVLSGCAGYNAASGGTAASRSGSVVSSPDDCPRETRARSTYRLQNGHLDWQGWTCEHAPHS
jgi:hypothetical protein